MASATERYLSEALGTYLLVFTVGCNVLSGSGAFAALSIASVLMVSIYALGGVSGAHLNPAVSFAFLLKNPENAVEMGIYAAVQIGAGILAAFSYFGLFGRTFNLAPGAGFNIYQACAVELIYTFLLVFVVLNTAGTKGYGKAGEEAKSGNQFYGLAIGFTIVAGGYAGGWISGGAFNPAVAIAIDLVSFQKGFGWCIAYVLAELAGGAAAYGAFMVVRPEETKDAEGPTVSGEKPTTVSILFAEALGTFFLVLTVGLNVLQGPTNIAAVLSIASALMVMIYALGDVSGGHFNPAVTVALVVRGAVKDYGLAGCYAGAQVLGGLIAGLTYWGISGGRAFGIGPAPGFGWASVAVAELVFTFVLCFVVLSVASLKKVELTNMFGFAIGFCVVVGGYAIGGISGGALNPAVAIGLDAANVLAGGVFWKSLMYTVVELAAGVIAAFAFMGTRSAEMEKEAPKGEYGAV